MLKIHEGMTMHYHIETALKFAAILAISTSLSSQAFAQSGQDRATSDEKKADDDYFLLSAGADYTSGDYGDVRSTKVFTAPVAVKYVKGPVSFRVAVPFVRVRGPGSLLSTETRSGNAGSGSGSSGSDDSGNSGSGSSNSGSGSSNSGSGSSNSGSGSSGSGSSGSGSGSGSSGSGSGGSSSGSGSSNLGSNDVLPGGTNRRASGVGDVVAALTYSFEFGDGLYFDVTGKAKLPTASTRKRLGTGKADFTAVGTLAKGFGRAEVYAEGRRKFAGSSVAFPIRDTWGASAGSSYKLDGGTRIGLDYDWQQASIAGNQSSSEITGTVSFRLSKVLRMQLYGTAGLNANSVDQAFGMQISYRFD